MKQDWWKEAVVYQVYPQSFCDTNHDGIGDFNGIRSKLDYLKELGVNLIWINPCYQSPMVDNGYDISDYYQVNPMFGTNEDLDALIQEAKEKGIGVLLDLVVNDCSDEHPWFQKAVQDPESEEADYFIFKTTEDGQPPNNWRSNFGGPAWTQVPDGRWYLHTFDKRQPDFNWENPDLREKLYNMVNWWLDKGIAGFRVDAITFIKKDLTFASVPTPDGSLYQIENYQNYPGIGEFLTELRDRTYGKRNAMTVAEAVGVSMDYFPDYAGENGYFSMIFDFNWYDMKGEADKSSKEAVHRWRQKMFDSQEQISSLGCWSGGVLESHDEPRGINKFLEPKDQSRTSAACLGTIYFFLPGTPFIYQGQELGMTNSVWNSIEDFKDVMVHNRYRECVENGGDTEALLQELREYSRDNGRTPIQWDDSEYAGFSDTEPWIPVNPNYPQINAAAQQGDPSSVLSYYKKLVALRRDPKWKEVFSEGKFIPQREAEDYLIAYRRVLEDKTAGIFCNFTGKAQTVRVSEEVEEILLNNCDNLEQEAGTLTMAPYQAVVLSLK
ncbi:Oligo-1%2C6-glucosidase [uncultured Ruminococcus sp.]|nr:Oligo-1%2C6-glucosidase [uncultured Clostridium sp.]SCI39162.1 Oligo-1%2C6-glucosidase [uncultured Ruminococcus sp.]